MIGRYPLKHLVPFIMLVTIAVLIGTVRYYISPQIERQSRDLTHTTMNEELENLRGSLSPDLAQGDKDSIERSIFFAATDPQTREIMVIDADGIVLYSQQPSHVGQRVTSLGTSYDHSISMAVRSNTSNAVTDVEGSEGLLVGYAGLAYVGSNGNTERLTLYILNDYSQYAMQLTALAEHPVFIATGIIIGAMLLLMLIIRLTLTNRISHLMDAAARLGAGEEGARVGLKGGDEFAKLGSLFDQMAEYVENSYDTMKEAIEEAESASHAKSDFLANMSHEIRTPLTGVLGMLDAADQADLPPNARKYTRLAQASAQTLLDLINDILDISQLEAGKKSLNVLPCRVDRLARNVKKAIMHTAQSKGIELGLEQNVPGVPWVASDEKVIRQVMFNLVGNAVKFTDKGSVTIKLDSKFLDEGKNRVAYHLQVVDTGVGISDDDAARLFNRFEQVEDFSNSAKGTGLGLAISRELVELLGGKIWVESKLGEGSTFHVTFECETVEAPQDLDKDLPSNAVPYFDDNMTVLAVDDNPINRLVIEKTVRDLGLDIQLENSGEEALEEVSRRLKAGEPSFDIILMDIHMPGMDGVETLAEMRILGGWANSVPAIALTAHAITGQADEFIRQGMSGYVSKPIDRGVLAREIARLTNGRLGSQVRKDAGAAQQADVEQDGKTMSIPTPNRTKPVIKTRKRKRSEPKEDVFDLSQEDVIPAAEDDVIPAAEDDVIPAAVDNAPKAPARRSAERPMAETPPVRPRAEPKSERRRAETPPVRPRAEPKTERPRAEPRQEPVATRPRAETPPARPRAEPRQEPVAARPRVATPPARRQAAAPKAAAPRPAAAPRRPAAAPAAAAPAAAAPKAPVADPAPKVVPKAAPKAAKPTKEQELDDLLDSF